MIHRSTCRRYWSALTGDALLSRPERHWQGQSFRRRYLASFFVSPQPPSHNATTTAPARSGTVHPASKQAPPSSITWVWAKLFACLAAVGLILVLIDGPSSVFAHHEPTNPAPAQVVTYTGPGR